MVSRVKSDPVTATLQGNDTESMLQWIDAQQTRRAMRRRAFTCTLAGWLLLTTAALVSSVASVYLTARIQDLLEEAPEPIVYFVDFRESDERLLDPSYLPVVLVVITATLIIGGMVCLVLQRVPGFSRTISAIDLSMSSDAVARMVSTGCTFPDAFRAAADLSVMKQNRDWFLASAHRVERGGPELGEHSSATGDVALVETLVSAVEGPPENRWRLAANHLANVSERRLAVLLQSLPMIATILSGLIIWLAISATLGPMWQSITSMLSDSQGGFFP